MTLFLSRKMALITSAAGVIGFATGKHPASRNARIATLDIAGTGFTVRGGAMRLR